MADYTPKHPRPDLSLSLYQIHCRYARLHGLTFEQAAALWDEMKSLHKSREAHIADLFRRLRASGSVLAGDEPAADLAMDRVAAEGAEITAEVSRRCRDKALASARIEVDKARCRACGYAPPRATSSGATLNGIVLDVHHIEPIADGERDTNLADLVTLCPTCHRLLHAVGRTVGATRLDVALLRQHLDSSGRDCSADGSGV